MDDPRTTPGAVGLVAIGRNEGERLRACLISALGAAQALIYVDSGSDDDSMAIAQGLGVRVVHLDVSAGFTAAKARNAGAAALEETASEEGSIPPEFIQFVDGDCELVPGWIETARARLAADPALAAVAGRRRERFPDATRFNRLCDMEWNTPVGPAKAVGGDALYRAVAFRAVGGFDPDFICGEEPELCFRLRAAGWTVERIDAEMTRHDAAMTEWRQWRKRNERSGWAFAEGAATYGTSPERYNVAQRRSVVVWGGIVPAAILALTALAIGLWIAGSGWGWVALAGAAVGVSAYPLMARRVARYRMRVFGDPARHATAYGALVMLGKPFQFLGAMRHAATRAAGRKARIIEYKSPAPGGGAPQREDRSR
jgi:GT2 family glycosyltransferase